MRRFFKEDLSGRPEKVELDGEEFHHLKKVLRLSTGNAVCLFNGKGLTLSGRIESLGKSSAVITIEGAEDGKGESPVKIVLLQALLKGDRPEFIVQKATELGATGVCFYLTPRTVPRVDSETAEKKISRWRKITIEAAKQCGRSVLPDIRLAKDLREALSSHNQGLRLQLWEQVGAAGLKTALSSAAESITALVGPEGGLSIDEAEEAEKAGFRKVSLGPRILRAETAAVAIISVVQHAMGDLD